MAINETRNTKGKQMTLASANRQKAGRYTFKGHQIERSESNGRWYVVLDGETLGSRRTLRSAKYAIDRGDFEKQAEQEPAAAAAEPQPEKPAESLDELRRKFSELREAAYASMTREEFNAQLAELVADIDQPQPQDYISAIFKMRVTCPKCGGSGQYVWGAIVNGKPTKSGVCFGCKGSGKQSFSDMARNRAYWNYAIVAAFRESMAAADRYDRESEADQMAENEREFEAERREAAEIEADERQTYNGLTGEEISAELTGRPFNGRQ